MRSVGLLESRDRVDVKRSVGSHGSAHFHMLALVSRNRRGIFDGDHLLIFVRNQDWLLAALYTLLSAPSVPRIRTFRPAL